jgi:hypothetical protein
MMRAGPALVAGVVVMLCGGCAGNNSGATPPPGCAAARPAVLKTLSDLRAQIDGRASARTAARAFRHDVATLDAVRNRTTSAPVRRGLLAISAQMGLYAIVLENHPTATVSGTGKRFLKPFDDFVSVCGNGSF